MGIILLNIFINFVKIFNYLLPIKPKDMSLFNFLSSKKRIRHKKRKIRDIIRKKKRDLTREDRRKAGKAVFKQIEQMSAFVKAEVILLYWSTRKELPTHEFIQKWKHEKTFLLPSIHGRKMNMKKFISYENLIEGERKIKEPQTEKYTGKVDLAIIPGVAFDKRRNRMGRGKGYYDRFLSNIDVPTYGVCFDFQVLKRVPTEKTDIKMDRVITPKRMIK